MDPSTQELSIIATALPDFSDRAHYIRYLSTVRCQGQTSWWSLDTFLSNFARQWQAIYLEALCCWQSCIWRTQPQTSWETERCERWAAGLIPNVQPGADRKLRGDGILLNPVFIGSRVFPLITLQDGKNWELWMSILPWCYWYCRAHFLYLFQVCMTGELHWCLKLVLLIFPPLFE